MGLGASRIHSELCLRFLFQTTRLYLRARVAPADHSLKYTLFAGIERVILQQRLLLKQITQGTKRVSLVRGEWCLELAERQRREGWRSRDGAELRKHRRLGSSLQLGAI